MSSKPTVAHIRLNEDSAFDLAAVLDRERIRLLVARTEMWEDGLDDAVAAYNVRVGRIKRMQTELSRTIVEMGWYKPPFGEER